MNRVLLQNEIISLNIRSILQNHRGRNNRIGRWELVEAVFCEVIPYEERTNNNRMDRAVRLEIGQMRKDGVLICTDPAGGYYLPDHIDEALKQATRLEGQAKDLLVKASRIRKSAKIAFGGQGRLL